MIWRVLMVLIAMVQVLFGVYLIAAGSSAALIRSGYVWIVFGSILLLIYLADTLYRRSKSKKTPRV
jgi:hypothetical protein